MFPSGDVPERWQEKVLLLKNSLMNFSFLPIQVCEIATIKDLEADAVDNFRVFFARAKFVVWHQTKQCWDKIFDAHKTQVLPEWLWVEEGEKTSQEWLVESDGFIDGTLWEMLRKYMVRKS